MPNDHIISIEREAKLSIDTDRLEIAFANAGAKHYVAAFDIAILIIANPCVQLSSAVSKVLAENGAVILYVGKNYMPLSISLPIGINIDGAKRPHLQAKYYESDFSKIWWSQIVISKVCGQINVLKLIDRNTADRIELALPQIKNGDENNIEGLAAKIYWPVYLKYLNSNILSREKKGACDITNVCLNYGYSIVRSMVARSLTSFGLCLNLGVGHHRKDNAFNLADDFIEPFRCVADLTVLSVLNKKDYQDFNTQIKKELIKKILETNVSIENKKYRLFQAIDFAVNSYCVSLEDPRRRLLLPNMDKKRGVKINLPDLHHTLYE